MTQALSVKTICDRPAIKGRFEEVLGKRAPQFVSSMLALANTSLKGCCPNSVVGACMIAATLDLPIQPELGLAYVIPYNSKAGKKAQFQMGYKGLVQLAIRSGQYRYLNCCPIYEGQLVRIDKLSGSIEIDGTKPDEGEVIGYAAYLETVTGFAHAIYWTKEQVLTHAKRFSQAFSRGRKDSPWTTDFDAMAQKTVLKHLLSHWGPLSVALQESVRMDQAHVPHVDASPDYIDTDATVEDSDSDDDSEKGIASLGPASKPVSEELPQTKTTNKEELL